jgi:thiazole synthase ThiGH ThiG subunit
MTVMHTKAVTPKTDATVAAMIPVLEVPISVVAGLVAARELDEAVEFGADDVMGAGETEEVGEVTEEEEVAVLDFGKLAAVGVALTIAGRA